MATLAEDPHHEPPFSYIAVHRGAGRLVERLGHQILEWGDRSNVPVFFEGKNHKERAHAGLVYLVRQWRHATYGESPELRQKDAP